MGERAAGPMAKRMTSPQPGAFAAAIGRPKMATEPLPASTVPSTQGAVRTRATPIASAAAARIRQPASARADQDRAHRPGQCGDDDQRDDGRREGGRRRDHGAEDGDLARRGGGATSLRARPRTASRRRRGPGRSAMKGNAA